MATIFDRNSEQGFVFASMIEFFQCWSSKQEAALSIQCKQGRASLNFTCSLGEPDQQHVEVKKVFKRRKKKSPSQIKRDNSRAAARAREEAARAPPTTGPPGPPAPTPADQDQPPSPAALSPLAAPFHPGAALSPQAAPFQPAAQSSPPVQPAPVPPDTAGSQSESEHESVEHESVEEEDMYDTLMRLEDESAEFDEVCDEINISKETKLDISRSRTRVSHFLVGLRQQKKYEQEALKRWAEKWAGDEPFKPPDRRRST